MAKILVIDDDPAVCTMLASKLSRLGHTPTTASTLKQGTRLAGSGDYDIVLLDVQLPDGNGLDSLPSIRSAQSQPEVIIITGKGDPDGAEQSIRSGAWAYIEKPDAIRELQLHLTRALQFREEKHKTTPVPIALRRRNIIGHSTSLNRCLDTLANASASDAAVLITGETGTGKELFARALHANSSRSAHDFVIVDCAALPESLIENILFGHKRGAFTGAEQNQAGLILQADQGTLFLDEIGELPPAMQKSLLRVLQEHRFRPIGSSTEISSDFRIVAATNRNLDSDIKNGNFRKDLLFRLKSFNIHLPPLQQRRDDIPELILHFLIHFCSRYHLEIKGFTPEFLNTLISYNWPGNVRELMQVMEQTVVAAGSHPTLYPSHLPETLRINQARAGVKGDSQDKSDNAALLENLLPWRQARALFEKEYLINLLEHSDNNISQACRISGLSRTRFYQLLDKYELKR